MNIAIAQSTTGIDPVRNAADLVDAVHEAARGGAAMLFTPEMSGLLDGDRARAAQSLTSEEEDGVLAAVRAAAAAAGIWVELGSLALRRPDGKLANRSFVIDAEGRIRDTTSSICSMSICRPASAGANPPLIRRARRQ